MNVRTSRLMKLLTVAPICAATLGAFGTRLSEASDKATQEGSAATATEVASLGNGHYKAIADVVAVVSPSVVSIRAVTWTDRFNMGVGLPDYRMYDSLRDFFGRAFMDQFFEQRAPTRGYEHRSVGSGVILSHDGHVLTNAHVIGSAEQITVVLHDGRALQGEMVGIDPQTDLALLKIGAPGLVAARPAPLNAIRIGQDVLAIGNPFGCSPVVSRGVLGTAGRGNASIAAYEDFMQTDIPVHLANTGGPLINLAGEVVGIATDRPWHGAPSPGPGFVVPIHMAQVVMRNLIDHGEMRRPTLGVVVQNLTENLATSFGFQGTDGVLVSDVAPGGSGEKAGLRSGDIILRVHDSRTEGANAFHVAVSESPIGELVAVEFVRASVRQTAKIQVSATAHQRRLSAAGLGPVGLGLVLQTVTPADADRVGEERTKGVRVTHLESGSLAAQAGMRTGDVIVAVGDQRVTTVDEFHVALRQHNLAAGVRLQLTSDGMRRFVFLQTKAPVSTSK